MGANTNLKLSLFEKLYSEEDADFSCPLYEFTMELQAAVEARGPNGTLNELLQERLDDFKRDEEQIETDIAVQQHAKDKLLIELKRTENALQALEKKRSTVVGKKKFAVAAMSKVTG